jgi:hypothetical protein
MLAYEFQNFYFPYFLRKDLSIITALDADLDDCENNLYVSRFDFSMVEDLPLQKLVKNHINRCPKNTVFVTSGIDSDIVDFSLRSLFSKYRPDIEFVKPYHAITEDWIELAAYKYMCTTPWEAHVLYTVDSLLKTGKVAGSLGPFIEIQQPTGRIVVQDFYETVPLYLYGLENPRKVIPNFSLPLSRAYVKEAILDKSHIKSLSECISAKKPAEPLLFDKSNGVWHKKLINRNWQSPSLHDLKEFT